ncbi:MAG: hypothetical protein DBY09_03565 [Selenomonadales bacterium]|nr:MAG: hypothetical protein DBY09_03565 [Selenomonadales bacterium]
MKGGAMDDKEEILFSRLEDLAEKWEGRGIYVFSDFLSPEQARAALDLPVIRKTPHMLWGGLEYCERKLICFGTPEIMGYQPEFPITLMRVRPAAEKFAQELGHRDFLGAVMNLGVKRQVVGDIFVNGNSAYMFLKESIAAFAADNLNKVKNTPVKCELLDCSVAEALDGLRPKTERMVCTAASERLDGVVSAVYNLSRGNTAQLIKAGLVQINHRTSYDAAVLIKAGDLISVRGRGRFIYNGVQGQSKKGRLRISAELYMS